MPKIKLSGMRLTWFLFLVLETVSIASCGTHFALFCIRQCVHEILRWIVSSEGVSGEDEVDCAVEQSPQIGLMMSL